MADEGPLSHAVPAMVLNLVTDLHSLLWNALLAAAVLHVAAISIYAVAKGQNLLWPMLTGRKQLPDQITPPRVTSLVLAGVVLGGSAAAVALLATFRVRRDEGALVAGSNGRKPLAQASRKLKKATLRPKITQN